MTSTAPLKPCTQVDSDDQPKLTTKSAMANGTTTSTAQTLRQGRSVRSTRYAATVPITAQRTVTTTVRRTVFHKRLAVSERQIRCQTLEAPAPAASVSRKASGSASTATTDAPRRSVVPHASGRLINNTGCLDDKPRSRRRGTYPQ